MDREESLTRGARGRETPILGTHTPDLDHHTEAATNLLLTAMGRRQAMVRQPETHMAIPAEKRMALRAQTHTTGSPMPPHPAGTHTHLLSGHLTSRRLTKQHMVHVPLLHNHLGKHSSKHLALAADLNKATTHTRHCRGTHGSDSWKCIATSMMLCSELAVRLGEHSPTIALIFWSVHVFVIGGYGSSVPQCTM